MQQHNDQAFNRQILPARNQALPTGLIALDPTCRLANARERHSVQDLRSRARRTLEQIHYIHCVCPRRAKLAV